ncbi:cat eye syndrome critical region protein 6 [Astyanax mexicanus]|nr:cat eye syndrome critical region protein 6 [Astyanax mexicanus]
MIAQIGKDNPAASCPRAAAAAYPDSPASSAPEHGQLFLRRPTQTSTGSVNPEGGSTQPLVPSASACASAAANSAASRTMTSSGEFAPSAGPLFVPNSRRNLLYKALCFAVLAAQGAVLDYYLIAFTDLYWCSWIATDLVVLSGWAIFFAKNSRSKRERACGFRQKGSLFGCRLGEFAFAYLAWLIYVIACAPKVVLILETSILELVAQRVPLGVTGFELAVLLAVPLLFCLINSVAEDPNGATRHHSRGCFTATCMDVLDSFVLVEALVRGTLPTDARYVRYAVVAAHVVALAAPVVWLYELTASRARCRWAWARFLTGALVNAPLLAIRCVLVLLYHAPASLFLFKNAFFLACACLELIEQCANARSARRLAGHAAQVSHCVSENDMGPHGYVNTLAVSTQP